MRKSSILRQERVAQMKALLTERSMSTMQMAAHFGWCPSVFRRYFEDINNDPDGRIYAEDYYLNNGVWVALWRFGNGISKPYPKQSKQERDIRSREKCLSDPERRAAKNARRRLVRALAKQGLPPPARRGRPAVRVKEELTPEQIEARNEQIREQRERHEREQRAAAIKPRRDPYAWFMFGGMPTGGNHVY